MKIGLYTDSLHDLSFTDALDWCVDNGVEAVEIGTGGFSPKPHCDLQMLLDSENARSEFLGAIESRGLNLSALNCNGNPLDPDPVRRKSHEGDFFKTIEAANKLGIDVVVAMSGCPGDKDGGTTPNWVVHPHQEEFLELLEWQWDEVVTPFWERAGHFASEHGVKVAIEMHPGCVVYNTRTMLRLREVAGKNIGANFDPSHLFYQGMEPLVVIAALGKDFVFHVHAKDTRLDPQEMEFTGGLDPRPFIGNPGVRAWEYRTLGYGHGVRWWCDFVSILRLNGYDGSLSIEHEDEVMGAREGIIKSIEFLQPIVLRTTS